MAQSFKDRTGRTWTIDITITTVKRVKQTLGIDLMNDMISNRLIERLMSDPIMLFDLLYVVLKPDVDQLNISEEKFGLAMAGDCIEHATRALIEALIDFFPNGRDRDAARKVFTTAMNAVDKARDLREANLEQKMPELINQIISEMTSSNPLMSGESSMSGPESSVSIPTP